MKEGKRMNNDRFFAALAGGANAAHLRKRVAYEQLTVGEVRQFLEGYDDDDPFPVYMLAEDKLPIVRLHDDFDQEGNHWPIMVVAWKDDEA